METKIIQIGSSLGIVLPEEALKKLNFMAGDVVQLTEAADGLHLSVSASADAQLAEAREIMAKRRIVLAELAK